MKVRMKATVAGTIQGQRTVAGQVVDVPDGAGEQLCSQGLAEPVAEKPSDRAEIRDGKTGDVACTVDGCDYTGTKRGLAAHQRSHDDD